MSDKPEAKKPEPTAVNYNDEKFLDEQIALATEELHQFELQCQAQINFRRGGINALQAIKDKKALISSIPIPDKSSIPDK